MDEPVGIQEDHFVETVVVHVEHRGTPVAFDARHGLGPLDGAVRAIEDAHGGGSVITRHDDLRLAIVVDVGDGHDPEIDVAVERKRGIPQIAAVMIEGDDLATGALAHEFRIRIVI